MFDPLTNELHTTVWPPYKPPEKQPPAPSSSNASFIIGGVPFPVSITPGHYQPASLKDRNIHQTRNSLSAVKTCPLIGTIPLPILPLIEATEWSPRRIFLGSEPPEMPLLVFPLQKKNLSATPFHSEEERPYKQTETIDFKSFTSPLKSTSHPMPSSPPTRLALPESTILPPQEKGTSSKEKSSYKEINSLLILCEERGFESVDLSKGKPACLYE